MKKLRNILAVIGGIVLLLAVFKFTQVYYEGKLEDKSEELRIEKIRSSKLEKTAEGRYNKIVADSLEKEELTKIIDSLEIEVANPMSIENIVVMPKDKEGTITDISVEDSLITFTDYYPSKEDPYIKYYASLNIFTSKYTSRFRFKKIPITVVIDYEGNGISRSYIKVPDFLEVESYDFQSTRLGHQEPDNFGWLVGAGYFNNILRQQQGLEITAGLRYKKVYLLGSVQTNSTVGLKTLIEF